ncbi:MAG: YitT family protein [Streptococcaceae bacterium]|jgi:uncharacterized membrane-anchored protein YitT (DUF2179 family)|nr:YitT family protein [Streptococcaceae bacterium]
MKKKKDSHLLIDASKILIGNALYTFGIAKFIIPNYLADNATSGLALFFRYLTGLNPAIFLAVMNIFLLFFTRKVIRRREWGLSILGASTLSLWLYFWQLTPIHFDLGGDLLIAALLAGTIQGLGLGLIMRSGGTFGGASLIARLFELKLNVSVGKTLFGIDIIVLALSLIYVAPINMLYTLIACFMFAQVTQKVSSTSYTMTGMIVVSDKANQVAEMVTDLTKHRVTFIEGEEHKEANARNIVYTVVDPRDFIDIKREILENIDPAAFISVFSVQESFGETKGLEKLVHPAKIIEEATA